VLLRLAVVLDPAGRLQRLALLCAVASSVCVHTDTLDFPSTLTLSWLPTCGPLVCVPTHRQRRYRRRRKARFWPVGLDFSQAGFAPAGRRSDFMWSSSTSHFLRTSIAWSQQ